jgi:hypothetical protein
MTTITAQPNNNLTTHPVAREYRYSNGSKRYIDSQGRFVPAKAVRAAVDKVIDGANGSVQQVAKQLQAGEITLAQWQTRTAQELKLLHVANGLAALGGQKQASQSDLGYMGSLIKKQYQYLNEFAKDIASGLQKLDGSFLARVKLYSEAGRGSYESVRVREAKLSGVKRAKRKLGVTDSCPGCLREAARGWVDISEVAPIGSQDCKTNCHCEIILEGE